MTLMARSTPVVRPAEPTPTLRFIAGEHAARIAEIWPAPHGAYLEMPAQRRHLAHIVLAAGAREETARLRAALEGERGDVVARRLLGGAPTGFVRALARIGEMAWSGEDYLRLFGLFSDEGAAAVLLQTPHITVEIVRALEGLPAVLRRHAIARHLATMEAAEALGAGWRAIRWAHGEAAAAAAVARWARAVDAKRLFAMAAQDVAPRRFEPAPFPVHPDMLRLGGAIAIEDAGRRFRNCLATYVDRAATGLVAVYEWAGPPPAAVSFARDGLFGWRLEEARGVGNAVLGETDRAALIAVLLSAGVHVGRSGADIRSALRKLADQDHDWINPADPVLAAFGIYPD
jgi:hypothetical protein